MGHHLLIIGDATKARIAEVVAHATKPENYYDPQHPGPEPPGDDPRFRVETGTVRAVFTITKVPFATGLIRHLSVSIAPERNAFPAPLTVYTLATLFGFTGGKSSIDDAEFTDQPGPNWMVASNAKSADHPIPNIAVGQVFTPGGSPTDERLPATG